MSRRKMVKIKNINKNINGVINRFETQTIIY